MCLKYNSYKKECSSKQYGYRTSPVRKTSNPHLMYEAATQLQQADQLLDKDFCDLVLSRSAVGLVWLGRIVTTRPVGVVKIEMKMEMGRSAQSRLVNVDSMDTVDSKHAAEQAKHVEEVADGKVAEIDNKDEKPEDKNAVVDTKDAVGANDKDPDPEASNNAEDIEADKKDSKAKDKDSEIDDKNAGGEPEASSDNAKKDGTNSGGAYGLQSSKNMPSTTRAINQTHRALFCCGWVGQSSWLRDLLICIAEFLSGN